MLLTEEQAARFDAKFIRGESDECWPWTATASRGYGQFWVNGKHIYAHRISYELANGHIPDGLDILHRCDNPGCVNPSHLFVGTHTDNMRDMMTKNRWSPNRGEANGISKLTEPGVIAILSDPRPCPAIAKDYGVSAPVIRKIKRREAWTHVSKGEEV